jgi:hypothetical protein
MERRESESEIVALNKHHSTQVSPIYHSLAVVEQCCEKGSRPNTIPVARQHVLFPMKFMKNSFG